MLNLSNRPSVSEVYNVTPSTGSVSGGTEPAINGVGFHTDTRISIGGSSCVVTFTNYTTTICTTSTQQSGMYTVALTSGGISFLQTASFEYSQSSTPQVTGITPSRGQQGQMVTISGTGFSSIAVENIVRVGGSQHEVDTSTETTIQSTLGVNFAGNHEVEVTVSGVGNADGDVSFFYTLEVSSLSPVKGSLAGLNTMTVSGAGFNPNQISITICNRECQLSTTVPTLNEVQSIVPSLSDIEAPCK